MGIIEWQRLWSGGFVETGYRLLAARDFIIVAIIIWVVVCAINVRGVCV